MGGIYLNFNLYLVSKYRTILMGLAIVMVVFHHLTIRYYDGVIGHLYGFLRLNGAIGVDIFLFVSAIGLVVSWQKNKNILQFYNRRIKRILPTYFILCTPIYIYISGIYYRRILDRFYFILTLDKLLDSGKRVLVYSCYIGSVFYVSTIL